MSNLIEHAKAELAALGYTADAEEGPNKWIAENVLELIEAFSKQGHSGCSAPFCVQLFQKLALYEPISPLTGVDDEWVQVADNLWQNKRCSRVFKESDGRAYDIEGKVFVDPGGFKYTNRHSRVSVTFPYTPRTQYLR